MVDKIDSYLLDYDFLPVMGPPLVSDKFKKLLSDNTSNECQFFPITISDGNNIVDGNYYILNVTKVIECVDEARSYPKVDKSLGGLQKITTLFLECKKLEDVNLCRIKEDTLTIVFSEKLVKLCIEKKNKWN